MDVGSEVSQGGCREMREFITEIDRIVGSAVNGGIGGLELISSFLSWEEG